MHKRQQITESFGLGGVAVILVAIATHYGKPISLELAGAIVCSLSPVVIMTYGGVRRYFQKRIEKSDLQQYFTNLDKSNGDINRLTEKLEVIEADKNKIIDRLTIQLKELENKNVG